MVGLYQGTVLNYLLFAGKLSLRYCMKVYHKYLSNWIIKFLWQNKANLNIVNENLPPI